MNCIHIERTKLYELYGTAAQCNSTVVTSYTYYTCNYNAIRKRNTQKALHVPGQLSPLAFNIRAQIKQQTT